MHGYAKGFGYQPGDAVGPGQPRLECSTAAGRWQLLDATWAAGGVDERKVPAPLRAIIFWPIRRCLPQPLAGRPALALARFLMTPAAFAGWPGRSRLFRLGLDLASSANTPLRRTVTGLPCRSMCRLPWH